MKTEKGIRSSSFDDDEVAHLARIAEPKPKLEEKKITER